MESYESVQLLVTLQAGKKVWAKGSILTAPLPPEIINEIRVNSGTVKVLKIKQEVMAATPPSKEVVMKEVEKAPEVVVEKPPEAPVLSDAERARLRRHSR